MAGCNERLSAPRDADARRCNLANQRMSGRISCTFLLAGLHLSKASGGYLITHSSRARVIILLYILPVQVEDVRVRRRVPPILHTPVFTELRNKFRYIYVRIMRNFHRTEAALSVTEKRSSKFWWNFYLRCYQNISIDELFSQSNSYYPLINCLYNRSIFSWTNIIELISFISFFFGKGGKRNFLKGLSNDNMRSELASISSESAMRGERIKRRVAINLDAFHRARR